MNTARTMLFAVALTLTAAAQSQPELQFDAATVKMGVPARLDQTDVRLGPGTTDPGLIVYHNINLRVILLYALGGGPGTSFPSSRLFTPAWMDTQTYDLTAKVPAGATKAQANQMMLNLLRERFHLKFHHEMRQVEGYEMTIAKNGLKIKESANPDAPPAAASNIKYVENDFPQVEPGFTASPARIYNGLMFETARNQPLQGITRINLGAARGGFVEVSNKTGLTGKYDWNLKYVASLPISAEADPPGGLDIIEAYDKQLGLHLEKRRITLDAVVVDSADKVPTDN